MQGFLSDSKKPPPADTPVVVFPILLSAVIPQNCTLQAQIGDNTS